MKRILFIVSIVVVCLAVSIFCLWISDDIGITKDYIQDHARERQNIHDDWCVSEQTSNNLSAMIFYNEDLSEHTFSLYINRDGFSFGYFFYQGGIDASIQNNVREFALEGLEEKAYISMNPQRASLIQISNGADVRTEEIDPNKPFAVVVKMDSSVVFLDAYGTLLYE